MDFSSNFYLAQFCLIKLGIALFEGKWWQKITALLSAFFTTLVISFIF